MSSGIASRFVSARLHRILKRQEHARDGTLFRRHRQQIAAIERDRTGSHRVVLAAGQNIGERGLAGADAALASAITTNSLNGRTKNRAPPTRMVGIRKNAVLFPSIPR
jgi:hypothetical protein